MPVTPSIHSNQKGFTLVELVMSIVILGAISYALLNVFSVGASANARAIEATKANFLAQIYFEEILSKHYSHPSGSKSLVCDSLGLDALESSAQRMLFNDVDDYDGVDDQPPMLLGKPLDRSYPLYRAQVSVECISVLESLNLSPSMKAITLKVTTPSGREIHYSVIKSAPEEAS